MKVRVNEIWQDNNTGAKYRIMKVETDIDFSILNIKIQNINNAGAIFDLGEWELKNHYTKLDDLASARSRG